MDPVQAAVLGAVQGLTEFLPISSKSHLIIVPTLLGWDSTLTFDIAVHLATLLAVLIYFRADWARVLTGLWRGLRAGNPWRDPDGRLFILLVLASIPVMIAGLALQSTYETAIENDPLAAARISAALLLVTGVILVASERLAQRRSHIAPLDTRRAMAVGLAQATAILPGISRSGVTIAAGLSSGLAREDAARFSFMLSTPTILAAGVVQAASRADGPPLPGEAMTLSIGFVVAFVVGYLAIAWLIRYLSRAPLYAFAVYTWVFGLAALWLLR